MTLITEVKPMSYFSAENLALDKLIEKVEYSLDSLRPLDVIELLETIVDDDLSYEVSDSLPGGVEGRACPDGLIEISEETYRNAINDVPRARFTLVHEMWHGWEHCYQLKEKLEHGGPVLNRKRGQVVAFKDPEWQANALAGATLMPLPALRKLQLDGKLDGRLGVARVAGCFKVSREAAKRRIDIINNHNLISRLERKIKSIIS